MFDEPSSLYYTRFLASDEARIHPIYREKIIRAGVEDTVYSTLFDIGWENAPHRTLRNSTVEIWEMAGCPPRGKRPNEGEVIAHRADGTPIVRYSDTLPLPSTVGNVEALALYAGQSAGLVKETKPAADIVREMVEGAKQIFKEWGQALR